MKRILIFMILAAVLLLAACNNKSDTKQATNKQSEIENELKAENEEPDGPLQVYVLKADQDAGATIENHPIYNELQKFAKRFPDAGTKDDYSITVVDATNPKDGKANLLLLGINRLPGSIKDVSFRITVGDKEGHYVVKDHKVEIPAEVMGVLKPGYGHPIMLPITEESLQSLKKLDTETRFVKLEDTKVSKAD